jgi:hypothetical protein
MRTIRQSTAVNVMVFMTDSTDHITGKTGLTLTITASKDGAAFASITPTVTARGDGWYNLALTTSHTDTAGDLALHITSTGADPSDVVIDVEPNSNIRKNQALSNFEFLMIDSADHFTPKTGLTITSERSIDGGAFGSCANAATAVGNGIYKIDLATTDLNGNVITLRFTATGADPRLITIITTPQ